MNKKNEAIQKLIRLNFRPNNLPFFEIHEPTGHCKKNNKINWTEIMKLISSSLNAFLKTPPFTRSRGKATWINAIEVVIKIIDNIKSIVFLFHFFWLKSIWSLENFLRIY